MHFIFYWPKSSFVLCLPTSQPLNAPIWLPEHSSGFLSETSQAATVETNSAAAQALKYLRGDLT